MNSPSQHNSSKLRSNHKDMYKSPLGVRVNNTDERAGSSDLNAQPQSPVWREIYKKRCFDEFKKSRQKLVNKFRNFNVIAIFKY
jgi:hypothetical protein